MQQAEARRRTPDRRTNEAETLSFDRVRRLMDQTKVDFFSKISGRMMAMLRVRAVCSVTMDVISVMLGTGFGCERGLVANGAVRGVFVAIERVCLGNLSVVNWLSRWVETIQVKDGRVLEVGGRHNKGPADGGSVGWIRGLSQSLSQSR